MIDTIQLSAMVFSLVEVLKMAGLPSKFAPLLAVALGIGLGFMFMLPMPLLDGLISGLTASGVYAGVKASMK